MSKRFAITPTALLKDRGARVSHARSCPHPHAEDSWKSVTIGGVTLSVTSPCPRCTVPDVEQASGRVDERELGPMRTLRDYRQRAGMGTIFGIYLRPTAAGATVRVGDVVSA